LGFAWEIIAAFSQRSPSQRSARSPIHPYTFFAFTPLSLVFMFEKEAFCFKLHG